MQMAIPFWHFDGFNLSTNLLLMTSLISPMGAPASLNYMPPRVGLSCVIEPELRQFIEDYREEHGLRSVGESTRNLLTIARGVVLSADT